MENQEYKKYSEEQLLEIITIINEKAEKDNAWLVAMWKGLSHDAKMHIQKLMKEYHFARNIGTIAHIDHGITTISNIVSNREKSIIIIGSENQSQIQSILSSRLVKSAEYKPEAISIFSSSEKIQRGTNKLPKKKKRKK
jgi:hypothetical protein